MPPGSRLRRFAAADEGATLLEYALLATLIGVACAGAVGLLGPAVAQVFAGVRF